MDQFFNYFKFKSKKDLKDIEYFIQIETIKKFKLFYKVLMESLLLFKALPYKKDILLYYLEIKK
jgi:hypothetical protein